MSEFQEDLTALVLKHNMEDKVGVPNHIIVMIMQTSLNNYCSVFQKLEEFYIELREDANKKASEVVEDPPVEDHLTFMHLD
jgi:hypothetical protein